ncbi:radical SAM protein [Candidatus Kapabacteria bacterium]|nr:radical SAM protein [Candidatus Kapabacteria bacterium]
MKIAKDLNFNINEIFFSIQGEGTRAGRACTFVRLQGCLLRCVWCDTPYALERKEVHNLMSGEDIFNEINKYPTKFLMLTGGEPLEQDDIFDFIKIACEKGFEVVIETNGQVLTDKVDKRAVKILDIKCPDSKMEKKNNYKNLELLNPHDELKFVIASRRDFDFAIKLCDENKLYDKVSAVLFSPVFEGPKLQEFSNWVMDSGKPIRMQLQLHKYIWSPQTRGV